MTRSAFVGSAGFVTSISYGFSTSRVRIGGRPTHARARGARSSGENDIERTLHRYSTGVSTELADYVERVELLLNAGDGARAFELIQGSLPEAWHGFRPERLASILESLIASGVPDSGLASGFLRFVRGSGAHTGDHVAAAPATADAPNVAAVPATELPDVLKLARAIELRMSGSVAEALELLDSIGAVEPLQPVFDSRGGWDLMITVQHGVTAILAGRFDDALTILTRARFQAPFASLVCLSRDALVKTALLHAAFGDQREARIALDQASALPRSVSWIEARIDVAAALADAMLDSTPAEAARDTVRSVPLADVGEMWPFYAIALHRTHVRSGNQDNLAERIAVLERVPFPYRRGAGFAGSVLPLVRAAMAMDQGDSRSAEWFASGADPEFIGTRLVQLRINARGSRARRVPRSAATLAATPGADSLRRFSLWRSASLIEALLSLGRDDEAVAELRASTGRAGGLTESERELFSVAIERFGPVLPSAGNPSGQVFSAEPAFVPDLPMADRRTTTPGNTGFSAEPAFIAENTTSVVEQTEPGPPAAVGAPIPASTYLTPREREVVEMLATDLSRSDIAAELFISINTLKKHLRIIYDKLDVTRRDAAVRRARLDGWLTDGDQRN